ncbi:hypothetical protein N0B40_15255 [Chryseobacterium oranimense]|uniref:hypothetical protein n=1 Tax=Chryseobacterium oranimense TaxID=421058 RepID=UPI0021B03BE9|nr:hypothetical protein [Chryseobacterium oranimense]UWX59765.1 hypothetical protein N0B40_15255 [Chryseobacterium oranimense]
MKKKPFTLERVQAMKSELNALSADERLKSSKYITNNSQTDPTIVAVSVKDLVN